MSGTYEDEFFIASHFRAGCGSALTQKLYNKKIELKDELSYVLILPNTFINSNRQFTDLHHIRWVLPYQLLQVFLHCKWPLHLGKVFYSPIPQVSRLGPGSISSHCIHHDLITVYHFHYSLQF